MDSVALGGIEPLRDCVCRTWITAITAGQDAFSSVLQ
jgi:hypothetical protein